MDITLDQAIEIYARVTVKWFGDEARRKTQDRIRTLNASDDLDGVRVFIRVLREVERIEQARRLD